MTKDAEKLLRYIVDESKKQNNMKVFIEMNDLKDIPNIRIIKNKLLKELESAEVISGYTENVLGELYTLLSTDGQEYFEGKGKENILSTNGIVINMSGGQFSLAKDNSTINATQNNGINSNELDGIIKGIMENLTELKKKDADEIADVVEMAKNELAKPEPRVSRLRNCLSLIAPMFAIANGVSTLVENLQKLQEFINLYLNP